MNHAIRILVADDHPMVRECLTKILESQEDLQVVGKASNGVLAIEMVHSLRPDVVLMDYDMPLMDGMEATKRILDDHPEVSVIALSVHEGPKIEKTMRKAGAIAFCQKGYSTAELLTVIRECSELKRS